MRKKIMTVVALGLSLMVAALGGCNENESGKNGGEAHTTHTFSAWKNPDEGEKDPDEGETKPDEGEKNPDEGETKPSEGENNPPKEDEKPAPQYPDTGDEGEDTMEFSIGISAADGCDFVLNSSHTLLIYKDSSVYKIYNARDGFTVRLKRGRYIARIDGLGDAYLQYEANLDEAHPHGEIVVIPNPEYDPAIQGMVTDGDKMFNFLVKDTLKEGSENKRLYELGAGKKLIYIDFFFVACGPCEYLLGEHIKFYNTLPEEVRSQILVIMVDMQNNDTAENINLHRQRMHVPDAYITMAKGSKVFSHVEKESNSVPYGVFLDENFTILSRSSGADFEQIVKETFGL